MYVRPGRLAQGVFLSVLANLYIQEESVMEKKYDFQKAEKALEKMWQENDIYRYQNGKERKIFSIDTPPPTVSGKLHIGHVFSYTQAEMIARFKRMQGYDVFYPFGFDDNGLPTTLTHEKGGYFDLGPIDLGENVRRDMILTLEDMGFEIEASHHEVAPAQHEIDFRYDEALITADNIMTFKLTVKTIAKRHGLYATFMPKPKYGINGSGMHVNMSLATLDGRNVFADENDERGLSEDAYHFIAGLMAHAKGMTAITNPLVNSYKRLVPGHEAPVYIAWSSVNRSPLIRIPAGRGETTRVELRSPDPAANPYLVLAACLSAGLDGIKRKLTVPDSVDRNIFEMTQEERDKAGIEKLPENLYEAIQCMQEDKVICDVLGEHIVSKYAEAKLKEWNDYRTRVSQWELDEYLYKF